MARRSLHSHLSRWGAPAALAFVLFTPASGAAQSRIADAIPESLRPALQDMRRDLALTEEQSAQASTLLVDQISKAAAAVENFGGISFNSVVDLLGMARSIREEFIPQFQGILTAEQRTKLAEMPKSREIYVSAMAGWFAEARVNKLKSRVNLTEAQIPQVRDALLSEFREAINIIEGISNRDTGRSSRSAIFDAVVDLRGIQRSSQRAVERTLTPEQRTALDAYERESNAKSEKAQKGS